MNYNGQLAPNLAELLKSLAVPQEQQQQYQPQQPLAQQPPNQAFNHVTFPQQQQPTIPIFQPTSLQGFSQSDYKPFQSSLPFEGVNAVSPSVQQQHYQSAQQLSFEPPSAQDYTPQLTTQYQPSSTPPYEPPITVTPKPLPVPLPNPSQNVPISKPSNPPSKAKSVDITTITTYPAALRHIMQLVASDPSLTARIRGLIDRQAKHERQWWTGRQELVAKLEKRGEGRKKLRGVLQSLGAKVSASNAIEVEAEEAAALEEDKRELQQYDRKVYAASRDMEKGMGEELAGWGIPFFGVIVEEKWVKGGTRGVVAKADERVRKQKLLVMRKKVVELLEDLCKE
ncbi:MAG: hypothetical protein M1834_006693 [Cirrosporium novae-zelandiae]|nr:MAG: hypothetical protein M1834_006693 [Cirrosporium novae-zelandiae]